MEEKRAPQGVRHAADRIRMMSRSLREAAPDSRDSAMLYARAAELDALAARMSER